MKKTVLIFGSIAGLVSISILIISMSMYKDGSVPFENGELIGYTTMVLAFSTIFFAVKSYRDRDLGGSISFGKGFLIGALITLVASVVYSATWEVYFNNFFPDFLDKYAAAWMKKEQAGGADAAKIEAVKNQIEMVRKIYKVPILRFVVTMTEMFPVGLLISLISAGILRKRKVLPA